MHIDLKKFNFCNFVFAAAAVSVIEILLILAGIVSPLSEMSPANNMFSLLMLFLFFAAGWNFSGDRLRESVGKGVIMSSVAYLIIVIGVCAGRALGRPTLGVFVPSQDILYMLLLLNLFVNLVLGAVFVSLGAFFGRRFKGDREHKHKPKARGRR